ncbi:MAG: helix-turn-helix transcriptional regulator [Lachnospiraceae bacterium]|nr:helix-turn-helix transcriptional regulator [Lachnospiraceae bacterium]
MFNIPFIDMTATGQNINRLRTAAGLSVRQMQTVFGFTTPQAIYKWIHGDAMPTIDNLVILAAILDVTLDDIVVVRENDARKCG